ncbi:MAG: recombination mediator RecR [Leadbetterella sp.]
MNFPSKYVEEAVSEISKLPGIGKKSALRLALHLLKSDNSTTDKLTLALQDLVQKTQYCKQCHSISDSDTCEICSNLRRDDSILAVVQDTRDVMAIENTSQFLGKYHVLGGVISPIEGIGPSDIRIDSLLGRISQNTDIKEVILALSPTMEGDTTAFYIKKQLQEYPIKISTIARGIPIGGALEFTDEVTLGRSILTRVNF